MACSRVRSLWWSAAVVCAAFVTYGCAPDPVVKAKRILPTQFDEGGGEDLGDPLKAPDKSEATSGTVGSRQSNGNGKDGGRPDSNPTSGKVFCSGNLASGDLAIVELMIAGSEGSGDMGEWLELQSTRNCWLKVKDLIVTTQSAARDTGEPVVGAEIEIAPYGTIVIADTQDAELNRNLFGPVFAWGARDALKNDGDTIIVKRGTVEIERLTYPAFANVTPGRALSFPTDCPWNVRSDWNRWSLSFREWTTGLQGTPNTSNDDVTCY